MNNNKVLEWDDLPKEIKLMMIDRMIENKELNEREITVALEIRKEIEDGRDGQTYIFCRNGYSIIRLRYTQLMFRGYGLQQCSGYSDFADYRYNNNLFAAMNEMNNMARMYKSQYEDEKNRRLRSETRLKRRIYDFTAITYELLINLGMSDAEIIEYYRYKQKHK